GPRGRGPGPPRPLTPLQPLQPSQPGDDARQDVDALRDGLLADGGVAEDEAAGARVADPVGRDALDADPGPGRLLAHGRLVQAWRQPGDQVQAGGHAGRLEPGQPPGYGG